MAEPALHWGETDRRKFLLSCVIGAAIGGLFFVVTLVDGGKRPSLDSRIDPNAADAQSLTRLPGIGPSKADSIINFRDEGGVFGCAEDLQQVRGIGPKTVEKLRPYLKFEQVETGIAVEGTDQ